MRSHEFITEELKLNLPSKDENSPARQFIKKLYSHYPRNPINDREFIMMFDNEQLTGVELGTSIRGDNWVTIKFFYTYPQRSGIGTKALQTILDQAQQDKINIELYTWEHGRTPVSALRRFYSKLGFKPLSKTKSGPTTMLWKPK